MPRAALSEHRHAALFAAGIHGGPGAWRWRSDDPGTILDDVAAWERLLGEMRERSADSDQLARIEGDAIVIRVPLHALVSAMEWHPLRGDPAQPPKCRIVDLSAFAAEVVDRLNDFGEGNDCPVTEILDDAMHDVIDAGSESIWIAGDPQ